MGRASEDLLAELHGQVALSMSNALQQSNEAQSLLAEHDDLPRNVRSFLRRCTEINPSLLSAATKFLKDNNISCDLSTEDALDDLSKRLQEKRRSVTSIEFAN